MPFPHLPWRTVLLAVASACTCWPAQAIVLRGTFAGIASAEPLPLNFPPPRPIDDYDGATITGSFEVNVPDPVFYQGTGSYAYFLNGNGGYLSMSFRILGEQFDIHRASPLPGSSDLPSLIVLDGGGASTQTAQFLTDFRPRFGGGILTLTGPTGSLFTGLDASTLHLDPDALPSVQAYFADSRAGMTISFEATSVNFDLATPVPEAPAVWMGLAGLALVAAARRRR